jgi:NAD(P)-dependent dehydrogenase (short-subunit alcohol dehydrogenase family)
MLGPSSQREARPGQREHGGNRSTIATSLAREGAHVIITGRTEAGVNKAIAGIAAATGGDVVGFAGDLGTAAAAEEVVRRHRDIEILVNNLGIFEPKPFQEIQDSDWMRFFEVNV